MSSPHADLPHSTDITEYCAKRLKALGIEVDKEWLTAPPMNALENLAYSEQAKLAVAARAHVPKSTAIWEQGEFYRYALPLAVFDLINGPFLRFDQFEFLYVLLLGPEAKPWLPSLFLSAAASPTLTEAQRFCLLRALDTRRLSGFRDQTCSQWGTRVRPCA